MIRQAAVLVGGLGTRLGPLTRSTPKPLLPVGDRPFLAWLLRELSRFGIGEALLLAGHRADQVEAAAGIAASLPRAMTIRVVREDSPAGTGGALARALDQLEERFLLCNGDSLIDANLAPLLARFEAGMAGRLLLRRVADAGRFGVVELERERIGAFRERPGAGGEAALINAGMGVFARGALAGAPETCSLERDILPRLAASGALHGIVAEGYFIDIGVPEDFARAQADVPAVLSRPALFLDRDGVINVDHGYVGSRERFAFMPGALEAIRAVTETGWHVFVVTNQSGVARGYYTEADVAALHDWLCARALEAGGTIDDIRYCPFHPEATVPAYRAAHTWRKPAPGMILDLIDRWKLEPSRCRLIGDQPSDLEAAERAGISGHLFGGGDLAAFVRPLLVPG